MKVSILLGCFALLVILGFTYVDGQTVIRQTTKSNGDGQTLIISTIKSNEPSNARHIKHKDVSLIVVVPSMNKQGNIPMSVILANGSGETYFAGETGYFLDCKIRLKTDSGKPIGYSKLGSWLFSDNKNSDPDQYAFREQLSGTTPIWEYNVAQAF